jgi:hypothetical protein
MLGAGVFAGIGAMPRASSVQLSLSERCSFGALVVAWVLMAAAAPNHAVASIGKCTGGSITRAEENLLLEAARSVLPPRIEPVVSNLCVVSNRVVAEITTRRIPDSPTTTHWWVTNCGREDGEWMCIRPFMKREIEQRLVVDGTPRRVAMTIDKDTPLEEAKSLVIRAIHQYANPQLPYCGVIDESTARWQLLRQHHPLPEGETRIPVEVLPMGVMGIVVFDDVVQPEDAKIRIQLQISGPFGPAPITLPCHDVRAP